MSVFSLFPVIQAFTRTLCGCTQLSGQYLVFAVPWTMFLRQVPPLPMEFFSKNTGAGCHFLLQVIFLTRIKPSFYTPISRLLGHQCHLGTPSRICILSLSQSPASRSCSILGVLIACFLTYTGFVETGKMQTDILISSRASVHTDPHEI